MRALLLLVFLLSGCGDPVDYCDADVSNVVVHIVGGMPSSDRRATAVVRRNGRLVCSGVVLDEHSVLTAAHCVGEGIYSVVVGENGFLVENITVHPDYSRFPLNDLAILHLRSPASGPFPTAAYDPVDARLCTGLIAQGVGRNDEGVAGELREAPYEVLGVSEKVLTTRGITFGDGTCFGDSGGPLYAFVNGELQLAGLNSTGFSPDCTSGGQHVNMLFYWPWVLENM